MTIEETESKLKPCPFCGSNATIMYVQPHSHSNKLKEMGLPDCEGEHFVECTGCTCAMAFENDRQEVIDGWNKRSSI